MPRSRRPVTSLADAVALDAADPLAAKRELFELPAGIVYLDGNSLGALPKAVKARVAAVVADQWGQSLITSWNRHGWFTLASRVGDRIGRLVGAPAGTVICCDTISVNLFKLIAAATRLRPGRPVILSDSGNFPSDLYMAQGLAELTGAHRLVTVAPEEVADAIDETVALVMLTEVDYRSGRRHDMKALTRRAHDSGALILWDLAHSAGALPVDLEGAGADFAVGCTYKFLNGGPGAPAFLYVRKELQNDVRSPLSGWWGHEAPFAFDLDYRPAAGIARQQCGTQAILSMAALDTALDVFDGVDMTALRRRSSALCEALAEAVEAGCSRPWRRTDRPARVQRAWLARVVPLPQRLRRHAGADCRRRHRRFSCPRHDPLRHSAALQRLWRCRSAPPIRWRPFSTGNRGMHRSSWRGRR